VDFALAFYMVYEAPDSARFLGEASGALRDGGRLLLVEPKEHVSKAAFGETVKLARSAGLEPISEPRVRFSGARFFAARPVERA
jgi:SAM-dependent methyltransferase